MQRQITITFESSKDIQMIYREIKIIIANGKFGQLAGHFGFILKILGKYRLDVLLWGLKG